MCGINGLVRFHRADCTGEVERMNREISHRGPDGEGVFAEEGSTYSVGIGMRRLAVIDIEGGIQPMYSEDKSVVIVFNGEIYNHLEIKKELIDKQVKFRTDSDTEVILNLYLTKGTKAFGDLDGMFSFSIYDKKLSKIFLARDFFGEKPLYYFKNDKIFSWSSELKSFKGLLDQDVISKEGMQLYFTLTYIPAPFTIYDGVFKLEPNKFLEFSLESHEISIKSLSREERVEKFSGTFEAAKQETRSLVEESVLSRSISDVPIGTFLSGGVDSSIVSHCLARGSRNRIDTFSIGFKNRLFDESEKSRIVAERIKSQHHEFIIEEKDLSCDIDEILGNFDEPFADSSALPSFLISRRASAYVKVALTGDGGDEVFGGYNKYHMSSINRIYTKIVPKRVHKDLILPNASVLKTEKDNRGLRFKVRKVIETVDYDNGFFWKMISLGFKENELEALLKGCSKETFKYYRKNLDLENPKTLSDYRNIDKVISLEGDMLVKVDRTSMMSSLESRAPFLNKKLWEFSNSLPDKFLINRGSKKYILKEAFKDEFPDKFLEKSKMGFGVPVGDWLRGVLKDELIEYTSKTFIEKQGLFEYEYIFQVVNKHLYGSEDNTFKVWCFYCFQKWYKNSFLFFFCRN